MMGPWKLANAAACPEQFPVWPADVGPGRKFSSEGKVQRYSGNTIICPISATNPAFAELHKAYEALRASVNAANLAWLPPGSYHTTIFDGAADAYRQPGDWPQMLPLDASMEACNKYVGEHLQRMRGGIAPPIRMKIDLDEASSVRTVITLKPVDAAENHRLRTLRDELARATGIRHANHDQYRFHTSFAYYVRRFSVLDEAAYRTAYARMMHQLSSRLPVIELGSPEYCLFNDMFAFQPQFALRTA
jgi:hypothetical protein